MKTRRYRKTIFIQADQNQLTLLPKSLEELIPKHHMVRFVNAFVDSMDLQFLLKEYKGGGRPAYHPRILLKILIYGYIEGIYTSRKLAKAVRENINFMWLAGQKQPDFRTINRFRSSLVNGKIEKIFGFVIEQLLAHGFIDLKDLFIDGTKFTANGNKYKAVWKKNVKRYKKQLADKVRELLEKIEKENALEDKLYGNKDLPELGEEAEEISSKALEAIVEKLNDQLKETPDNKELKQTKRKIEKDYLPRQRRYERQEDQLGDRNSYNKTDVDATYMRKKADHHGNIDLRPSYNIQVASNNRYGIHYIIGQSANDGVLLKPFLEDYKNVHGSLPERLIADAGYGNEENYDYLSQEGVVAYVKYPGYYHRKKSSGVASCGKEQMVYEEALDRYRCPEGRYLNFEREELKQTSTGYQSIERIYCSEDCSGCPLKPKGVAKDYLRRITVKPNLEAHRKQVDARLNSEEGQALIRRRGTEIETVFGAIKHNFGIRRFLLRGIEKVKVEFGLILLGYDIKKMFKDMKNKGLLKELLSYFYNFIEILFPKEKFRRKTAHILANLAGL